MYNTQPSILQGWIQSKYIENGRKTGRGKLIENGKEKGTENTQQRQQQQRIKKRRARRKSLENVFSFHSLSHEDPRVRASHSSTRHSHRLVSRVVWACCTFWRKWLSSLLSRCHCRCFSGAPNFFTSTPPATFFSPFSFHASHNFKLLHNIIIVVVDCECHPL